VGEIDGLFGRTQQCRLTIASEVRADVQGRDVGGVISWARSSSIRCLATRTSRATQQPTRDPRALSSFPAADLTGRTSWGLVAPSSPIRTTGRQRNEVGGLTGSTVVVGWGLAATLLVLATVGSAMTLFGGLGARVGRGVVTAAGRAVVQLAVVSAVIVAVVRSLWLSAAFVLFMLVVAVVTSARRMTEDRSGLLAVLPIAAGAVVVLAIVLTTGVVPLTGIAVVPIGGIVLGGAMTATSLAGRRALDELDARRGEFEAALALGVRERDAARFVTRPSAAQALTPAMDQTRTVGLVTLPGAFVGVLLGSGDPVQAAAAQVLVLIGLLAAEAVAVVVTVELVARGLIQRGDPANTQSPRRQRWDTRMRRRR
jgi:putative ABC transport system permease protein